MRGLIRRFMKCQRILSLRKNQRITRAGYFEGQGWISALQGKKLMAKDGCTDIKAELELEYLLQGQCVPRFYFRNVFF